MHQCTGCRHGFGPAFGLDPRGKRSVECRAMGQRGRGTAIKDHVRAHALQQAQRFIQIGCAQPVHLVGIRDLVLIISAHAREMHRHAVWAQKRHVGFEIGVGEGDKNPEAGAPARLCHVFSPSAQRSRTPAVMSRSSATADGRAQAIGQPDAALRTQNDALGAERLIGAARVVRAVHSDQHEIVELSGTSNPAFDSRVRNPSRSAAVSRQVSRMYS